MSRRKYSPYEITDSPTLIRVARDTTLGHTPDHVPTVAELVFFTTNAQKTGANIPSLVGIIKMLDNHYPDFIFLTETPMHPHSGTLLHALRNWGYKIHHHPTKTPFQPDGLPEARLPNHITHSGGGCW